MIELDAIEYLPNSVQALLADALRDAAMYLNNEGLRLPENEWRAVRDVCENFETTSRAARRLSTGQLPIPLVA